MYMKHFLCRKTAILLPFLATLTLLSAQKNAYQVTRCINAMDRDLPVINIFVDGDNQKWVANTRGAFQVGACDLASPLALKPGEQSVFAFASGNADQRWTAEALRAQAKTELVINATYYDARRDWLFIGTADAGLFQFKTKPQLQLIEKFTTGNSKLKSNAIRNIYQDKIGRFWIGTESGVLVGTPGKWQINMDGYTVNRVREHGAETFILGDGELWAVGAGDKWRQISIDARMTEGDMADFDFDAENKLWALSSVVARCDLENGSFTLFSGAEDYTSEYGKCLTIDTDGIIWVGTADKGLYVIQKSAIFAVNCLVAKQLSCNGNGEDAELQVRISGGKSPYKYQWSLAGVAGEHPVSMRAGTYTVTVTDSEGKTRNAKVTIGNPQLKVEVAQRQPESGPGAKNGSAEATVVGGTGPYNFTWDSGEKTATALQLAEGTRSVTVTDATGCQGTASISIGQNISAMVIKIAETAPIACNDGQTSLKVNVSGGKGPFKFVWSNPSLLGEQPASVRAGTYTVTVTDASGREITNLITVAQPALLELTVLAQIPAALGQANGQATATAKGGSGGFTYKWDNSETAPNATKLVGGKHAVTVTDAKGCAATATVYIEETAPKLTASVALSGAIACNGQKGSLDVSVRGGKTPYQYKWSDAALSGPKVANLAAGNYIVTVTDASGAQSIADISIEQPPVVTLTATVRSPASTGNADGKAVASGKGGSGGFTYKWDNGETAATAEKLGPGAHTVTATDSKGCTTTASVSVSENILPLAAAIEEMTAIKCPGQATGGLKAAVNGGKGPFTYAWSKGGAAESATNLGAGDYQITVTDAIGTTAIATLRLKEPAPLFANADAVGSANIDKSDGKATVLARGGTSPYQYKWDNGETTAAATKLTSGPHQITVTDANGCTAVGSVGVAEDIPVLAVRLEEVGGIKCVGGRSALKAVISGGKGPFRLRWPDLPATEKTELADLPAGNYELTVSDAAGGRVTAAYSIKQPEALSLTAAAKSPASTNNADGKAATQVKGGTTPYQYKWDNGETTATAEKLAPGQRSVTVTDANGCTADAKISITENVLALGVSVAEQSGIKCAGQTTGGLRAEVSGGKSPFQYAWNKPGLNGEQPAKLGAGEYQVTVTDASGTTAIGIYRLKEPAAFSATATVSAPATTNNADGKAAVLAQGGTTPYQYKWDNGETAANAVKLAPGRRAVTVADANGCAVNASVEISENILAMNVSAAETGQIKCADQTSGIKVTVQGGKSPYQYAWSDAALSGDQPTGLKGGAYQVTVTDAAGTAKTTSVTIKAPAALQVKVVRNIGATTDRSPDGHATAEIKGGTTPYTVAWDNGEKAPTAVRLLFGVHRVTVTDANGCTATAELNTGKRILPELDMRAISAGQAIRMEQLRFDADSATIKDESLPVLNELYDFLSENGAVVIEVGGHTNSTPPDEFCDRLSTARAKAVSEYLIGKGIDVKRVAFKGYGKRKPIAPNETVEGRRKNQRVEIRILQIRKE